jgi:hypothetical protein
LAWTKRTERELVYVGEAEVVGERLVSHVSGKDFWTDLVIFTNKDDHLTKGHVKYLETRLVQLVVEAERYKLTNSVSPALPSLPRGDRDAMEEFIDNVRTLLGVLGHRAMEPLRARPKPAAGAGKQTGSDLASSPEMPELSAQPATPDALQYFLNVGGLSATAVRTGRRHCCAQRLEWGGAGAAEPLRRLPRSTGAPR